MPIGKRCLQLLSMSGILILALITLLVAPAWTEWTPSEMPKWAIPAWVLVLLCIPLACSVWVGRRLARRWRTSALPGRPRILLRRAALVAYLLTAVVGIPEAQTKRDTWAVSEYKRLKASGTALVWEAHPYVATYISIPVAPFLLLSYHEYQLDGLYGLGAFEVSVWYGTGVRSVDALPLWVSLSSPNKQMQRTKPAQAMNASPLICGRTWQEARKGA